jgi:hypothetical protein
MKIAVASFAVVLALASNVSGHYIFQQLSVGSTKYSVFEYVRKNTNYNSPVIDLSSNDLRCNEGGASGSGTSTVSVKAGDQLTFTLDTAVYHQGPVSVYMSRAPGSASSYDGSGGWFKIRDWGPTFSGGSSAWPYLSRMLPPLRSFRLNVPFDPKSADDQLFSSLIHVQHSYLHLRRRIPCAHPKLGHP